MLTVTDSNASAAMSYTPGAPGDRDSRAQASSRRAPRATRRGVLGALSAVAVGGLATMAGCQSQSTGQAAESPGAAEASATTSAAPPVDIQVFPAQGGQILDPARGVTIHISHGKVTSMTARDSKGNAYPGKVDRYSWKPDSPFPINEKITLTASVIDTLGVPSYPTFTFQTIDAPVQKFYLRYTDMTVGTGMPVMVQFNKAVPEAYRAAIEKKMELTVDPPQTGAWGWQRGGTLLAFRPQEYWKPGTKITIKAPLVGIQANDTSYFNRVAEGTMTIGPSRSAVVKIDQHKTILYENGKAVRTFPSTAGKPGWVTRSGKKVISEKDQHVVMDAGSLGVDKNSPEYYRLDVYWAMRVTDTGEFIHAAPWSVGSQGRENVSHGCVGLSMDNARTLYNFLQIGDVVEFTGSDRIFKSTEGIGVWQYTWEEWQKLSAVGQS